MNQNSVLTTTNLQQHFGWGFWDAASDFTNNRANKWEEKSHPNKTYGAGYAVGWKAAKNRMATEETLECQWDLHFFYQD